jgi:hypothetical protein
MHPQTTSHSGACAMPLRCPCFPMP